MYKILILLLLIVCVVPVSAGSKCMLVEPLVAYENLDRLLVVFKSAAASRNMDSLLSIFNLDIYNGQAILLPTGSIINVDETNPMTTAITTNGFRYYTVTNAIRCR